MNTHTEIAAKNHLCLGDLDLDGVLPLTRKSHVLPIYASSALQILSLLLELLHSKNTTSKLIILIMCLNFSNPLLLFLYTFLVAFFANEVEANCK